MRVKENTLSMERIQVDDQSLKKLNMPKSYLTKAHKLDNYLYGSGDLPVKPKQQLMVDQDCFGFVRRKSKGNSKTESL